MSYISDFLAHFTSPQIAFTFGFFILIFTVFLLSRRLIGFPIAGIFLIFALLIGFAIASKEIFQNSSTHILTDNTKSIELDSQPNSYNAYNQQRDLIKDVELLKFEMDKKTQYLQKEIDDLKNEKKIDQTNPN